MQRNLKEMKPIAKWRLTNKAHTQIDSIPVFCNFVIQNILPKIAVTIAAVNLGSFVKEDPFCSTKYSIICHPNGQLMISSAELIKFGEV